MYIIKISHPVNPIFPLVYSVLAVAKAWQVFQVQRAPDLAWCMVKVLLCQVDSDKASSFSLLAWLMWLGQQKVGCKRLNDLASSNMVFTITVQSRWTQE